MCPLSYSSASGPVHNPWLPGYSAGGSSSGCASLVAVAKVRDWRKSRGLDIGHLGEGCDLAVGGDQGGSIRLVGITVVKYEPGLGFANSR
jgi:amidase